MEILSKACVGKQSCTVDLGPVTFPSDPCFGTYKSLFVAAHCSAGEGRVTTVTPSMPAPARGGVTIPAQQSFVLEIPAAMTGSEPLYMWGGDRWQSAPDHFKSHDYMAWVPFHFSRDGKGVEALSYNTSWELALG